MFGIALCNKDQLDFITLLYNDKDKNHAIPSSYDGTYRLVINGWVLNVLTTHSVRFDDRFKEYKHTTIPIGFFVTFTECFEGYQYHASIIHKLPETHLNMGMGTRLILNPVSQDRAAYIRKAVRHVYGNNTTTGTCNIHIDRKFQDSSVISLKNKENKKIIKTHLNVWFGAKTKLFLHLMLHYSLKYISDHLKEDTWVKKFTKVYVKNG